MNQTPSVAAIVLAAGASSRMGTCKALLPLGKKPAIERVLDSVAAAGVEQVVVVTGYHADRLSPVLATLGAPYAYNARHESGMFSSVKTGVCALPAGIDAFFVLPVDCALVRPDVLRRLAACLTGDEPRSAASVPPSYAVQPEPGHELEPGHEPEPGSLHRDGRAGAAPHVSRGCAPLPEGFILRPTCAGVPGHPPLISAIHAEALRAAPDEFDLRSYFSAQTGRDVECEVEDLTILLDMDTPDDYERLARFAERLDAVAAGKEPTPTWMGPDDCQHLLDLLRVEPRVVAHCRTVATVGEALTEAVNAGDPDSRLDARLVDSAGLLHDMAKAANQHALTAGRLLQRLGYRRLGEAIGGHMVLPEGSLQNPRLTEQHMLYLADKLVVEDKVLGLEARTARALRRHGYEPGAPERIEMRMQAAWTIAERVERAAGRPLAELLRAPLPR